METGGERAVLALVVRRCHREVEREECNDAAVCQGRQRECGEVDQFLRRGLMRLEWKTESKLTYINVTSGEVATSSAARKPSTH